MPTTNVEKNKEGRRLTVDNEKILKRSLGNEMEGGGGVPDNWDGSYPVEVY